MSQRRALLIGVPRCEDPAFSPAISQAVNSDIQNLQKVLSQSYDDVNCLSSEDGRGPTRNQIRGAIQRACMQAPPNSILLLYFSGHGVTIDGVDYLVPSDAFRAPGAPNPDPTDLVEAMPDVKDCQARLVVFFIDACRDTPAEESKAAHAQGGVLHFPSNGALVMVGGCSPGQRCYYGEEGSVFTQTLVEVMDRRHPARTLSKVLAEVESRMRRRTGAGDDQLQLPNPYPQTMLASAGQVKICDGDELTAAWTRVAEENLVWAQCPSADDAVRDMVRHVAEACARKHADADEYFRARTGIHDEWFDPDYPSRVIHFTATLLGPEARLDPSEAALLIAAPFLREEILADGLRIAADNRPLDFHRSYEHGIRNDLELTHELFPHVIRRAEGFIRRERPMERDALIMWLVHRWISGLPALWPPEGSVACERGSEMLAEQPTRLGEGESQAVVKALLRAVWVDPGDSDLSDLLGSGVLPNTWRGYACVLWLAGILAADPRRMAPVIMDHIGTQLELPLATLKSAITRLQLRPTKSGLELDLACGHAALHSALESMAKDAEQVLKDLPTIGEMSEITEALPGQITAAGVRPDRRGPDSIEAYAHPLSRFRLAEDKIRELLMGRQLYEDPALAIRELYQNALDACRLREFRLEAARRSGRLPLDWTGRISFRQRIENGREYIECEDNGAGMSREILEGVFSSAGERFVHRHSYRVEQARWQSLNQPLMLVPNSQFGVGVFSYFMIADEIQLFTRPVDKNGIPMEDGFEVRVASSGSLFQISPTDEMLKGGTRIRLYLTGEDEERLSASHALRKLLWIAEYEVTVVENHTSTDCWQPKKLRYQDESAKSLEYDRDLWWVSGEGGLAADGIRTNEEIYGLIANLRAEQRPKFTVDRQKLIDWPEKWFYQKIDDSLPSLMAWAGLSLSWMWEVTESRPEVAQHIFEYLAKARQEISLGGIWGNTPVLPADLGCLPADAQFADPKRWLTYFARWFAIWRSGVTQNVVGLHANRKDLPPAQTTDGFPVPDPIDGALLKRLSWFHNDEAVPADDVLEALADPDRPASELLRRLRKYAITGLDLSQLRRCPPVKRTFKEDEKPLIRALAAWTPPGIPPSPVVAGYLVKASAQMDLPLGEVMRRAEEMAPPGWASPELDLGALADQTCTAAEAKLVSVALDGYAPWVDSDLQPHHVARAAAELGREIEQVLAMCDRIAPLGIRVAQRELYPRSFGRTETEALRYAWEVGWPLTTVHLVLIAGGAGRSLHQTRSDLLDLERLGFLKLPNIEHVEDFMPDVQLINMINNTMVDQRPGIWSMDLPPRKPCIDVVAHSWQGSPGAVSNLARRLVPLTAPQEIITHPELVSLAGRIFGTLADARQALTNLYPDVSLPPASPDLSLRPYSLIGCLVPERWSWRETDWSLGPGEIVSKTAEFGMSIPDFLRSLTPYRDLGVLVPEVPPEVLADVSEWYPDSIDSTLLERDDFRSRSGSHYFSEIDSLRLVKIAGRLGLTVAETHRRLARMVPLGLRLGYPQDSCPDEIVRWQDLLLLTTYVDGQAPCINGRVEPDHLRAAARETEESIAWLVDRLRLYAPLFALDLDAGCPDV